jgi:hypothetical protein
LNKCLLVALVLFAIVLGSEVYAQEEVISNSEAEVTITQSAPQVIEVFPPKPLSPEESLPPVEEMIKRVNQKKPEVSIDQIGSVFLTSIEENVIIEARKGAVAGLPTDMEFDEDQDLLDANSNVRPMAPREVSLGGVLYVSSDDWVVWINSEKITPKNIPSSIIDIRVNKDFVKLKWYDIQTNQIFPIKLRSHQRFNLDSRIFLPGSN